MRNQNEIKAKAIFEKYRGNHFQMEREGEYEKYKAFNISQRIEAQWLSDLCTDILMKLDAEINKSRIAYLFSQYGEMINRSKDESGLFFMLEFAQKNQGKLDSFTNLRVVESILNSISSFDIQHKRIVVEKALDLLRDVSKADIRVSDDYKEGGSFPDYLSESKINERISYNIKYWENEIKLFSRLAE